ncbi:MAG: putative periplasmic serine endoprotease DegP-like precursor [bacterium ADurb.Bin431]|nr:MAG: putative periplasmic serine endoprotease DegP-like precursor [bacterium ADurb.Bin431]
MTNNHVAGGASSITVTLADGREFKNAKLVGADPKTDLAVIKIEADRLIPARWGNSDEMQKGDFVLAFGAPFGFVGSMTHGIVSGLNRSTEVTGQRLLGPYGYEQFIQVDCPINPGNSGGPLVNLKGDVVGINTAILTRSGGFQGVGFAIPSNQAQEIYGTLKSEGRVTRGFLGVEIFDAGKARERAKQMGIEGEAAGVDIEKDQPEGEKETAREGHQQGLETSPQRFRIAIMRNQRPAAEGGHLPEEIELQQIGREGDADHRCDKEQQPGVVAGFARDVGVLPVARAQVGGGIEHDQKTEDDHHQQQEQGKWVKEKAKESFAERALQPSPGEGQALPVPARSGQQQPDEAEQHTSGRADRAFVGMARGQERAEHGSEERQDQQENHAGHRAFPFR